MKNIVPADVLEMLFSNRNKAYGAYALQRAYPNHLKKSLAGVLALPLILWALLVLAPAFYSEPAQIVDGSCTTTPKDQIRIELEPKKAEVSNGARRQRTVERFVPPVPVANEKNTPEIPSTAPSALTPAAEIGSTSAVGDSDGMPGQPSDLMETSAGNSVGATQTAPPEQPFEWVEQMPQFGQSEADLLKYLSKNIQYPALARESGVRGPVVIKALVNEHGRLSHFIVVRDPGGGLAKETLRVLQSMPAWKPGFQNGRTVKVWITIPVRFELQD